MSRLEILVVLFIKLFQSSRSMVLKDMAECLLTQSVAGISDFWIQNQMFISVKCSFLLSHPDKPNFSPENQFSMSSLAARPILAKLSYNKDMQLDNYKPNQ